MIGLGDDQSSYINVYIENRPPLDEYQHLQAMTPMIDGEIAYIAQATGNHWRKIFNVFAKFIFALNEKSKIQLPQTTWQEYRDQALLQKGSSLRLLFSEPKVGELAEAADLNDTSSVHIIMGKQYATKLGFHEDDNEGMVRLDKDFAIWPEKHLIVCPYFDYRQLSNIKIERLIELITPLLKN